MMYMEAQLSQLTGMVEKALNKKRLGKKQVSFDKSVTFNDDEEKEKEETKENDGDGGNVFPIFRRSSARTGLRGSPAKLASTPNKGCIHQSSFSKEFGPSLDFIWDFIEFDGICH